MVTLHLYVSVTVSGKWVEECPSQGIMARGGNMSVPILSWVTQ